MAQAVLSIHGIELSLSQSIWVPFITKEIDAKLATMAKSVSEMTLYFPELIVATKEKNHAMNEFVLGLIHSNQMHQCGVASSTTSPYQKLDHALKNLGLHFG